MMNQMSRSLIKCSVFFFLSLISKVILAQNIGANKLYYGAAYYPESWPREQVAKDIAHMKALNMNVMRMGEFAWSTMEPEEGKYAFDWLHGIIEELHAAGIDVILGTPSATPPAWMWQKYPEIALTDEEGLKTTHGGRRDTNYLSEAYRTKSVEITERMAKEFGNKPGVIGWQTDNEFSMNYDYSEVTERKWHQWLEERYGNIKQLNQI